MILSEYDEALHIRSEKQISYEEGIAEGKLEGIAEGKLEGIAEGKLEGIAEGKLEGIIRGKLEENIENILALLNDLGPVP